MQNNREELGMDATVRLSGQDRRFPVKPGVRCGRSADRRSDTPFSLPWLRATAAAELGRLTPCGPRTTPLYGRPTSRWSKAVGAHGDPKGDRRRFTPMARRSGSGRHPTSFAADRASVVVGVSQVRMAGYVVDCADPHRASGRPPVQSDTTRPKVDPSRRPASP